MTPTLRQYGPYPEALADLVGRLRYRPGWKFSLVDLERDPASSHGAVAGGLTLVVFADVHDSYHPQFRRPMNHYFVVPAATYDRRSWCRWLLERVLEVERHEACEWFVIDEERPFAPHHQPGSNPYAIYEQGTWEEADTDFRGNRVHPASP